MLRRLFTLTLRTLRNRLGYTLVGGLGLTVALDGYKKMSGLGAELGRELHESSTR